MITLLLKSKVKTMKQALQLFIITLLIVSCTKKQSNQIEQYDSMIFTDAEIRNQEIQDSLQQARLDSLALIAWGDAKFGMSMKETLSTNAFKNGRKQHGVDEITMNFDQEFKFKKLFELNNLAGISAYYQENELKRISIKSYYVRANYINELIMDCNIFAKEFTKKHGSPSFQKGKTNILDFTVGKEFTYAKFKMKDKNIVIKLGELYDGGNYYYIIYIEKDKFPKKKHVKTEKEKKEEQRRMKEAKEIKENSF